MEIRATCQFDKRTIKALAYITLFKKKNPKKAMVWRMVLCAFLLMLSLAEGICFEEKLVPAILLCASVILTAVMLYWYFMLPRVQYKALANMQGTENEYVFGDETVVIHTKNEWLDSQTEIAYSLFVKAHETSAFFFLWQTNNQVLVVDKATLENGAPKDIRRKLTEHLQDRYIYCKY